MPYKDIEQRRRCHRESDKRARAKIPTAEQSAKRALYRESCATLRERDIAVMDFETDPFDNTKEDEPIRPFLFVLYRDDAEPVVIWDEDEERFYCSIIAAIEELPRKFTVYAHNGGKFDFKFFAHRLRGRILLKQSAIMTAEIGNHELRDSMHIIPTALSAYRKDDFDYTWMHKNKRNKHRDAIIEYCINDCKYTLEMIKAFIARFGRKLSIGQAAIYELRQKYPDLGRIGEHTDKELREYFYGGRVECLAGAGHFRGSYKLYDVNSMYPYVMANFAHPAGGTIEHERVITENTIFIRLRCRNMVGADSIFGAFMSRANVPSTVEWLYLEDETENISTLRYGEFKTTIWEYNVAVKYGLISDVEILETIGFTYRSTFADFILPLYDERAIHKQTLVDCAKAGDYLSDVYLNAKRDSLFVKLVMNNAYGKFAQNPRGFKDRVMTDDGEFPSGDGWEVDIHCPDEYILWERDSIRPMRFNHVGTGASITGAARAVLLEAIVQAKGAIYSDTDSLICKELRGVNIDDTALGAWSLEAEFDEVIICGKKLYACRNTKKPQQKEKIVHKGAPRLTWDNYVTMINGNALTTVQFAPTIKFGGSQQYIKRRIRTTAKYRIHANATDDVFADMEH